MLFLLNKEKGELTSEVNVWFGLVLFGLERKGKDMWHPIPFKCTHTAVRSEQTHREHTPRAVDSQCCGAQGAVGGSVPCSRVSPESWYRGKRERCAFTPTNHNPCQNVYICTMYLNEIRLDYEHVQSQIKAFVATNPNKLNVLILNSIISSLKNVWNQVQNNLIKVINLQVIWTLNLK